MSILNTNASFHINSYPYNYIVIEDLFQEHIVSSLQSLFAEMIREAKVVGKVGEVGDKFYDALSLSVLLEHIRTTSASAFVTVELRELISNAFQIRLDENIILGMHRHNPPSKIGWTHTDFAVVSFPNIPPNFKGLRLFFEGCTCNYSDDTRDRQPDAIKTARAVACLYYIANPEWQPGMGGETGVYADFGSRLVARVPPKNNSLFAFEINPISYHAYLGSDQMQRNSFIWWYHSDPSYLLSRYSAAAEHKRSHNMDPWDRWTPENEPKYDTHPVH